MRFGNTPRFAKTSRSIEVLQELPLMQQNHISASISFKGICLL